MRRLLPVLLLLLPLATAAQQVDTIRSRVLFTIRNLGIAVDGHFAPPRGTVVFQPDQPANARLSITVPTATIATGIGLRDRHLRGPDYFDAARHPSLRFESQRVTFAANGSGTIEGQLTLKGINRRIQVPFTAQRSGATWTLRGQFAVNRRDYGIGGWSPSLSNEATVEVVLVVPVPEPQ